MNIKEFYLFGWTTPTTNWS